MCAARPYEIVASFRQRIDKPLLSVRTAKTHRREQLLLAQAANVGQGLTYLQVVHTGYQVARVDYPESAHILHRRHGRWPKHVFQIPMPNPLSSVFPESLRTVVPFILSRAFIGTRTGQAVKKARAIRLLLFSIKPPAHFLSRILSVSS
jgi:hypothetical protein